MDQLLDWKYGKDGTFKKKVFKYQKRGIDMDSLLDWQYTHEKGLQAPDK